MGWLLRSQGRWKLWISRCPILIGLLATYLNQKKKVRLIWIWIHRQMQVNPFWMVSKQYQIKVLQPSKRMFRIQLSLWSKSRHAYPKRDTVLIPMNPSTNYLEGSNRRNAKPRTSKKGTPIRARLSRLTKEWWPFNYSRKSISDKQVTTMVRKARMIWERAPNSIRRPEEVLTKISLKPTAIAKINTKCLWWPWHSSQILLTILWISPTENTLNHC